MLWQGLQAPGRRRGRQHVRVPEAIGGCTFCERGLTVSSKVYISFGGLLLLLDGPYKKLSSLKQEYVYLLLKK